MNLIVDVVIGIELMGTHSVSSWHVAVAAEAIAAAQFARCGWDVSVQYGANQPEYDLIIAKNQNLLKISVKGSQDGSWGLTQSYLKNAEYQIAIDLWEQRHDPHTIFCFVQFKGLSLQEMPRMYLATIREVAERLRSTAKNRGDTILYEHHVWAKRAYAAGTTESIPEAWCFSSNRIEQLAPRIINIGI